MLNFITDLFVTKTPAGKEGSGQKAVGRTTTTLLPSADCRLPSGTPWPAEGEALIPAFLLYCDRANYQRDVNQARVAAMLDNWDENAAKGVLVSRRADGTLFVIDGQHRREAQWQRGGPQQRVHCIVVAGLSLADEAALFVKINTKRGAVNTNTVAKAQVTADDPRFAQIMDVLCFSELSYSFNGKGKAAPGVIRCWGALVTIFDLGGTELLTRVLAFARGAWGGDPASLDARTLKAVAAFIRRYEGQAGYDEAKIIAKLAREPYASVTARAKRSAAGSTPATALLLALKDAANAGKRQGRLV